MCIRDSLTFADQLIWEVLWSSTGKGLFVIYAARGPTFLRHQIGYVSLVDGQVRPISRDTNSYSALSLSADGKTLAAVQQKAASNLYMLPGEGSASADVKMCIRDRGGFDSGAYSRAHMLSDHSSHD